VLELLGFGLLGWVTVTGLGFLQSTHLNLFMVTFIAIFKNISRFLPVVILTWFVFRSDPMPVFFSLKGIFILFLFY